MNVSLNLSPGQLSKLRNGHGIRVSRAMFGSGVDMIIDPMTYNNMVKKLERGKGAVISMSGGEIEQNRMEGTVYLLEVVIKAVKFRELRKPASGVISVMKHYEKILIQADIVMNN